MLPECLVGLVGRFNQFRDRWSQPLLYGKGLGIDAGIKSRLDLLDEAVLLAHLLQQSGVLLREHSQLPLQARQLLVQLGLLRLKRLQTDPTSTRKKRHQNSSSKRVISQLLSISSSLAVTYCDSSTEFCDWTSSNRVSKTET
ncbi:hypothetical protein EYF80_028996 [Liparis tanakae]|uniref:Uncharacterized protein n=1 Tax=Liparis tanakae TaxID=230148 RepID=A0A4Z2H545_9TELE|nr:hypothetical protein EYF80_028996 [Liparis tanakae]